jgi:hypothetical protein
MRLKATAVALAVAVGLGYYAAHDEATRDKQHSAKAQAPTQAQRTAPAEPTAQGTLPAPFRPDSGGGTPGDDFKRWAAIGTVEAAFDAYRLVEACQRQRQYDPDKTNPELVHACDGITPDMERQAGELLAFAMAQNVPGAAVEFWKHINRASDEQLKEVAESPSMREGVQTMIAALKVAAQSDREAIAALSLIYGRSTPIQQRDPAQALTYVTALRELNKGPTLAMSDAYVQRLIAELTPDQARAAQDAGRLLAKQCDCRG